MVRPWKVKGLNLQPFDLRHKYCMIGIDSKRHDSCINHPESKETTGQNVSFRKMGWRSYTTTWYRERYY